ncbi:hypothetical protein MBAV_002170 [Candidatus Magnetobacterium bavaricum]|uniref:Uncharacterized protein n=1 Tax=Candidatus Magnetobacterium bavaricum TaxID=29290 RepID=A0A0F3GUU7_9BACT|nr:hypothetical protein MBAV_002170 [Candidatus Magnetobacterium bavaricum]
MSGIRQYPNISYARSMQSGFKVVAKNISISSQVAFRSYSIGICIVERYLGSCGRSSFVKILSIPFLTLTSSIGCAAFLSVSSIPVVILSISATSFNL